MNTRTANNPAFAAEDAGPTFDTETASMDGAQAPAATMTAEQVTALVEKKVAQLLQVGNEAPAGLADRAFVARVESAIAEMHMAPPNLHQAVVFFAAERRASAVRSVTF
eukprot:SAG31_NODE_3091_length_4683_cov_47.153578_3_plen_109_part_00